MARFEKIIISQEEAFNLILNKLPFGKILITGSTKVGKTTFCKKLFGIITTNAGYIDAVNSKPKEAFIENIKDHYHRNYDKPCDIMVFDHIEIYDIEIEKIIKTNHRNLIMVSQEYEESVTSMIEKNYDTNILVIEITKKEIKYVLPYYDEIEIDRNKCQENVLTTEETAELLKISKQMISVRYRKNLLPELKNTKNGLLFYKYDIFPGRVNT